MSRSEHLVKMANDIGHFFAANPDREAAVKAISNHIRSFWTPRMRHKLFADIYGGDEELEELPREALRLLREQPDFKPAQFPEGGGDAG